MVTKVKSRPKTRLDKTMILWQGCQSVNQTFDDQCDKEWEFDVEEIRELLDESVAL